MYWRSTGGMLTGTGSAILNGGNITEGLLLTSLVVGSIVLAISCDVNILAAGRGVAVGVVLLVACKSISSEGMLAGGLTAWPGATAAGMAGSTCATITGMPWWTAAAWVALGTLAGGIFWTGAAMLLFLPFIISSFL